MLHPPIISKIDLLAPSSPPPSNLLCPHSPSCISLEQVRSTPSSPRLFLFLYRGAHPFSHPPWIHCSPLPSPPPLHSYQRSQQWMILPGRWRVSGYCESCRAGCGDQQRTLIASREDSEAETFRWYWMMRQAEMYKYFYSFVSTKPERKSVGKILTHLGSRHSFTPYWNEWIKDYLAGHQTCYWNITHTKPSHY